MSESRTGLKIISVVILALGLYDLIPGLILVFANGAPDIASSVMLVKGVEYTGATPALVFGILCVVSGLIFVLVGLLGWRGASDPTKIKPFFILAIIGSVFAVLLLVLDLVTGTWPVSSALDAFFVISTAVLANSIRKSVAY